MVTEITDLYFQLENSSPDKRSAPGVRVQEEGRVTVSRGEVALPNVSRARQGTRLAWGGGAPSQTWSHWFPIPNLSLNLGPRVVWGHALHKAYFTKGTHKR